MTDIKISQISITGFNPRKEFDPDDLNELKESIKEYGILEPLIVRPIGMKGKIDSFELVAGERRYRAAVELKLKTVPVVTMELSDRDVKEIMLIENLQRSDLAPLEEAEAIQSLLLEETTQETLGKKLGKSQSWIANRLRLLQAPEELKEMIISREITARHVLTLLPYQDYPIYKDIMTSVKKHLGQYHDISVTRLKEKIDDHITGYDTNGESVLNLSSLPWDIRRLVDDKFLDLKDCEKCKEPVSIKGYDNEDDKYCLNRRCWKDKVNLANQAYEKAQKVTNEKLAKKGKVNVNKMDYGTYNYLKYADFDKTECKDCDQCKLSTNDDKICLDPACYKEKTSAHSRVINKATREDKTKALEVLDKFLISKDTLSDSDVKVILNLLSKQLYSAAVRQGLKPWGDIKEWSDTEKIVKAIPEDDLCRALYRIVIIQYLSSGSDDLTTKKLKTILPEAFK